MNRFISRAAACVATLMSLASCDHKELCDHHPHTVSLRVEFDWRDAPDARAEGMCVYFYPIGGDGVVRRFDFAGMNGGRFDITVGRYMVLCYNNDTEGVLFDGTEAFDSHMALTREGSLLEPVYGSAAGAFPRAEGADGERIVAMPDMMWGCAAVEVNVTDDGVSYINVAADSPSDWSGRVVSPSERIITLFPHELVCEYTYEIRNVSGLGGVAAMCASLSGMAPTLRLASEELGEECVTLPVDAAHDGTSTIRGRFLTFGHNPANEQPHKMLLYVWMNDGSKYCYGTDGRRFDLTEQVHSAPDKRHVSLVIDGLDLPKPIEGESGFDASTDDWQEIRQDIHM